MSTNAQIDTRPYEIRLTPAECLRLCDQLTPREREVMRLLARGFSNKEIGRILVISSKTLFTHMASIRRKFGCHSRTEAAVIAAGAELLLAAEAELRG
jgi:DNA-binding CsgD family transcriptional regulator